MVVESLADNTVRLLADKVMLFSSLQITMDCSQCHSGEHDEQEKESDELYAADARGLGHDHVRDDKFDPD